MAPSRGFSLDPTLGLEPETEQRLVKLAAELGYESAWTPSGPGPDAFDRCVRWHQASGLRTGISVVPGHGVTAEDAAEWGKRAFAEAGRKFVLGVGSGQMRHPAASMRVYLEELADRLTPDEPPVYLAALGPLMLRLAGERAGGVALNWCSAEQVAWSRGVVTEAAGKAGRPVPPLAEYIRVCVDADVAAARRALAVAMLRYAIGPPGYRAHFGRMGFEAELQELERRRAAGASEADLADACPEELLLGAGCYGVPGSVRGQFERLALGLDEPIVRVVLARPGDAAAVETALREFA